MTGFRVALGGACRALCRSTPTSSLSAKSSAEDFPSASSAASENFMDQLAPLGPVYQAGTLSGNPLAMAAGIATLGYLQDQRRRSLPATRSHIQSCLRRRSRRSRQGRHPSHPNRVGAMGTWFFTPSPSPTTTKPPSPTPPPSAASTAPCSSRASGSRPANSKPPSSPPPTATPK